MFKITFFRNISKLDLSSVFGKLLVVKHQKAHPTFEKKHFIDFIGSIG